MTSHDEDKNEVNHYEVILTSGARHVWYGCTIIWGALWVEIYANESKSLLGLYPRVALVSIENMGTYR